MIISKRAIFSLKTFWPAFCRTETMVRAMIGRSPAWLFHFTRSNQDSSRTLRISGIFNSFFLLQRNYGMGALSRHSSLLELYILWQSHFSALSPIVVLVFSRDPRFLPPPWTSMEKLKEEGKGNDEEEVETESACFLSAKEENERALSALLFDGAMQACSLPLLCTHESEGRYQSIIHRE